jgi:hypothetical protein
MNNLEQVIAEQRRLNDNLNQLIKNLGGLQELGRQFAYGKGFGAEGFGNVTFPRFETFNSPLQNEHYEVGFRVKKVSVLAPSITLALQNLIFTKDGVRKGTPIPSSISALASTAVAIYEIDCDGFILSINTPASLTFYGF